MTFSIVVHDPASQSFGVAVASKCLAVGHVVPWGAAGAGALATQALANLGYGPRGLELLASGHSAAETVAALVGADPLAARRQLGVVDAGGRAASHTGAECLPWCGSLVDGEVAVQGNILAGEQVVTSMLAAYRQGESEELPRRLLAALSAGDAAGGDRRGRQSAAMRIWRAGAAYGGELDIALDLRVDDHPDPVGELRRLEALHALYFRRPDPATLLRLDGELKGEVARLLTAAGYPPERHGGFEAAFEEWIGTENYEERHVPGSIDPLVLAQLRLAATSSR